MNRQHESPYKRHRTKCDRCKKTIACSYYGRPMTINELGRLIKPGEWLCDPCVQPRVKELDEAIRDFKAILGGG